MNQLQSIIVAGSTGLVGSFLIDLALKNDQVASVISLSRNALKQSVKTDHNSKLIEIIDQNLQIDEQLLATAKPSIGFIALGSTKKKSASKKAFRDVDVLLVVKVAKEMKRIGVTTLCIVSSIGASSTAFSHYLKCKGEMEVAVEKISFEQIIFMQPGPLAGPRDEKRLDEQLLQGVMKLINPFMIGQLLNYKPIEAELVAKSMFHLALQKNVSGTAPSTTIQRVSSKAMFALKP